MKNLFSKLEWLLWLIILMPNLLLWLIWNQIPQTIPTHYNFWGEPDVYGDKTILIWLIPIVSFFLYLLLFFIPMIDPKKRIENMGKKYFTLRIILLTMISSILIVFLFACAKPEISFIGGIFHILSVFLIFLGNYLQTIKPNYFIGIRTPWTLHNEKIWQLTHRLGARVYMIGGFLLLLASLFLNKQSIHAIFFSCLLVILLIPFFFSFIYYMKYQNNQQNS